MNPISADVCVHCKAPLGEIETLQIPEDAIPTDQATMIRREAESGSGSALQAGTLALHVVGEDQPVILKAQPEIAIGRSIPGEPPIDVDLGKYHGHLLGVSRRHAIIRFIDDNYMLEDLGSSNGTWLNENQLSPKQPQVLRSGDQIRFGQLILFVYFLPFHSIFLIDRSKTQHQTSRSRITPEYLANVVSPYLLALATVQSILDAMKGNAPFDVGMNSISTSKDNVLTVNLNGAQEAARLVQDYVIPWRAQYLKSLSQFQPNGNTSPQVQMAIYLSKELMAHIAGDMPQDNYEAFVGKLVQPMQVLIFSPLELAMEQP
jgi:hypothetical protein